MDRRRMRRGGPHTRTRSSDQSRRGEGDYEGGQGDYESKSDDPANNSNDNSGNNHHASEAGGEQGGEGYAREQAPEKQVGGVFCYDLWLAKADLKKSSTATMHLLY